MLYLFKGDGGIIRVGLDLVDFVDENGTELTFKPHETKFFIVEEGI